MAVVAELDLMPSWVADGLSCPPWESGELVVPEIPDWLLDAPVRDVEPRCDCGCACLTDEPGADAGAGTASPATPFPATASPADPSPATPSLAAVEEPVRWAIPGVWDDTPAPVVVGPLVVGLQDAAERLDGLDPTLLSPGQARVEVEALLRLDQRLRVGLLARLRDAHDRKLYRDAGFRSLGAWLKTVAPDAVAKDVTLAKRLPDLPHVQTALHEGQLSLSAAGKVAGSMVKMRPSLDRPDGLIDGLPGEEVVAAVVDDTVDVIARDRFGLSSDDPAQAEVLAELEERAGQIRDEGGSQHDRVEKACVLLGEEVSPQGLPHALEDVVLAVVPSLLEDQDKHAQAKRALGLSRNDDGTWHVEATLTPEAGERLHTALGAEARRDPANPVDTALRAEQRQAEADAAGRDSWTDPQLPAWEQRAVRERDELLPDGDLLVPRSRSKRMHDALDRLLTRYLETGLGGVHGKVPVQVTVTHSTSLIEGKPGARPARGASGQPLARQLLRRWWCDAHVTVLLMNRGWKPLGVVHTARTITPTETKAARVRCDNRCPGIDCCPGTPDPLIRLVPHHVRQHAKHGRTSLEETLMVCERLHQDLHLGKDPLRLRDGRLITEDGFITDGP